MVPVYVLIPGKGAKLLLKAVVENAAELSRLEQAPTV
jgi:hypothetical protein